MSTYGPEEFTRQFTVSRETLRSLREFVSILLHWQKSFNLIGPLTVREIWQRHILDSAQIYRHLQTPGCLFDLGSGGGFPGFILAILGYPTVKLIESNGKKCTFLRNVSRLLGVEVEVIHGRIENYRPLKQATYITSRALAPLEKLLAYSEPLLSPYGRCFFLKGANAESELTNAKKTWIMQVQKHVSISDPNGIILEIGGITSIDRKTKKL